MRVVAKTNKIFLLFLLFVLPMFTIAVATPATPAPTPNPMDDVVVRLIVSENLKTRESLKAYMDSEMVDKIVPSLQEHDNALAKTFDQRVHDMLLNAKITFGIIITCAVFLGQILSELVLKNIYKRAIKSKTYQENNLPQSPKAFTPEQINQMTRMFENIVYFKAEKAPNDEQARTSTPEEIIAREAPREPQKPKKEGFFAARKRIVQVKKDEKALKKAKKEAEEQAKVISENLAKIAKAQETIRLIEGRMPQPPLPPPEMQAKTALRDREEHFDKIQQHQKEDK